MVVYAHHVFFYGKQFQITVQGPAQLLRDMRLFISGTAWVTANEDLVYKTS